MQADTRGNLRFDVALKKFVYDGLDDHYSAGCIQRAESLYGAKLRDLRVQQIEKNAKQHGLLVKSRKTESNGKIKIVMVRRTYG